MSVLIELPFPSAKLSGHHNAHWRYLQPVKAKHREWARLATKAAGIDSTWPVVAAAKHLGDDIRLVVTFYPPDKRGDRVNFPNRMKPYFDGIADALGVNDSRFLPAYYFGEPVKGGKVVIEVRP